ncbi:hypothetical protein VYU27_002343 [Nannochloropsis oceanica]
MEETTRGRKLEGAYALRSNPGGFTVERNAGAKNNAIAHISYGLNGLGEGQTLGKEEAEASGYAPEAVTAAASTLAATKLSLPSFSLASFTPPPRPASALRSPLAPTSSSLPDNTSLDLSLFLLDHASVTESDELLIMLEARLEKESISVREEALKTASVHGRMPLHLAAMAGSVRVVELLLSYGADANAFSQNETPLHLSSNERVAKTLLVGGADPSIPHKQTKEVALHVAIRRRDICSVQTLLERPRHRRSINERDVDWTTLLHLA